MKLISVPSGSILFTKRFVPIVWFGFVSCLAVFAVLNKAYETNPLYVLGPILLLVFSYFAMKYAVWNLADEVYDCGDHLLIRRDDKEDKVPLSEIRDALATVMFPTRMSLRFTGVRKFGSGISFQIYRRSQFRLFPWEDLAQELTIRANRARSAGNSAPPAP